MRLFGILIFFVGSMLITTDSYAQARREWKWCLHASGIRSCSFPTFEQCNKGRRAKGGHCERNPRYTGR